MPTLPRRAALAGAAALLALPRRLPAASSSPRMSRAQQKEYDYMFGPEPEGYWEAIPFLAFDEPEHGAFARTIADWLPGAQARCKRFLEPLEAEGPSTRLAIQGLHPAIDIRLTGDGGMDALVVWEGTFWDILISTDTCPEQPEGTGWANKLRADWHTTRYATREACWREDGLDVLLKWINTELIPATRLVLSGNGGWTMASLAGNNAGAAGSNHVHHVLPLWA